MNSSTKYNTLTYEEIDRLVSKHFFKNYTNRQSFENDLAKRLEQAKEEISKGDFVTFEDFCNDFKSFCSEKGVEYPLND
ncbi:MAG: hypothetical protein HFJ17_04480 [Clostridia bacterium]|nr:hypothetical protein [Clostridia bacterium]